MSSCGLIASIGSSLSGTSGKLDWSLVGKIQVVAVDRLWEHIPIMGLMVTDMVKREVEIEIVGECIDEIDKLAELIVHFLGRVVNHNGSHVDPSKIEAIKNWKAPITPSEIRSFLGLAAFQTLKNNLCDAPILSLPDGVEDFVVYCDASNQGLGCVLMQRNKLSTTAFGMLRSEALYGRNEGNPCYREIGEGANRWNCGCGSCDAKGVALEGRGSFWEEGCVGNLFLSVFMIGDEYSICSRIVIMERNGVLRMGYYKPGTRAWVNRGSRKIRIPVDMYPCRVEERLTIKLVKGEEVLKIETTVTANDVTITKFLGKLPGYKPTKEEEEISKLKAIYEDVIYDISDSDFDLESTARSGPRNSEMEDTSSSGMRINA
ncbi:putative reverse transcriptase domain-containing protein [Tanacetum coccineum]